MDHLDTSDDGVQFLLSSAELTPAFAISKRCEWGLTSLGQSYSSGCWLSA